MMMPSSVQILTLVCFALVVVVCLLSIRVVNLSRDLYVPADASTAVVRVASAGPLSLLGADDVRVDGLVVSVGDRVLALGQRSNVDNGVYVVSKSRWDRAAGSETLTLTSGSMIRVLDGQLNGGKVFMVFGDTSGWHFVSLSESVLGSPARSDDVLVAAPERPRGVRWARRDVLHPSTLTPLGDSITIPAKGTGIFELPEVGAAELHMFQHTKSDEKVRIGKVRVLNGKVVRRSGEPLKVSIEDGAVVARNAVGLPFVSAQLFRVLV